jgi:hypothetical protein
MDSNIDQQIRQRLTSGDGPEIPMIVKSKLEEALQAIEAEPIPMKRRNQSHRRKSWIVAAAVFLAAGGTFASGFVSPAMAETLKKVPFIGQIFDAMGDEAVQNANRKGLSFPVNLSAADQGITLTVTEILYDGVEIKLGVKETTDASSKLPVITDTTYRYEIQFSADQDDPTHNWTHAYTQIRSDTPGQNIGILTFEALSAEDRDATMPKEFPLSFEVKKVGTVAGSWKFHVPVQMNDALTKKITPMQTKKAYDGIGSIQLQSVMASPLGVEIRFKTTESTLPDTPNAWSGFNSNYLLTDENGYIISSAGGSGGPSEQKQPNLVEMEHIRKYDPLPDHTKNLIFKPYKPGKRVGDTAAVLNPSALPLTLQQGKAGSVTVKSIAFGEDRATIHYDVKGNSPVEQNGAVLFIQDGEKFYTGASKLIQVEGEVYSYVGEFPLSKDKEIKLYSSKMQPATYFKELEFQVHVP